MALFVLVDAVEELGGAWEELGRLRGVRGLGEGGAERSWGTERSKVPGRGGCWEELGGLRSKGPWRRGTERSWGH